jgi:RNase P/RNase MRP subunit p29
VIRGQEPLLRAPAHSEGTLTRGTGLTRKAYRVILDAESRGLVDLRCAPGERLPPDLGIGEKLRLALELDRAVLTVEGRVGARTGSTVRLAIKGEPVEVPRRRMHSRIRVNQQTRVHIERDDGRILTVEAKIVDLSLGGCSVAVDVVVPAKVGIAVEVDIPLRTVLTGKVIRAGGGEGVPGTIGVRFDALSDDIQGTLEQFLHSRRKRRVA